MYISIIELGKVVPQLCNEVQYLYFSNISQYIHQYSSTLFCFSYNRSCLLRDMAATVTLQQEAKGGLQPHRKGLLGQGSLGREAWLVVLRIYVAFAVFQSYPDLEAGDNQSLKSYCEETRNQTPALLLCKPRA